jgi:hypothetical protein
MNASPPSPGPPRSGRWSTGPPESPPYGGPANQGPGLPWTPPPRKRSGRPLAVLFALAVLGAVIIGIVYYEQDYKPRHYLREWSFRIASPAGSFDRNQGTSDNHAVNLRFSERCYVSDPCDPPPAKAIAQWVANDGGGVTEQTVTECFRDGGSFSYYHGRHTVEIHCERASSPELRFTFTARLGY